MLIILNTPIPISNTDDKTIWNFNSKCLFSINSITWANNTSVSPHPKTKFVNGFMESEPASSVAIFCLKICKNMLPTRGQLRHVGMSIDGDRPFCSNDEESIDRIFKRCELLLTFGILSKKTVPTF